MNRREFIKDVTIGTALLPLIGNLNANSFFERNVIDEKFIKLITDAIPDKPPAKPLKKHKILVYSYAARFYHKSIPYGNKCFEIMGEKTGAFDTVVSNNHSNFTADKLKEFDCIIINNCTGELLKPELPKKPWKPKPNAKISEEKFKQYMEKYENAKLSQYNPVG